MILYGFILLIFIFLTIVIKNFLKDYCLFENVEQTELLNLYKINAKIDCKKIIKEDRNLFLYHQVYSHYEHLQSNLKTILFLDINITIDSLNISKKIYDLELINKINPNLEVTLEFTKIVSSENKTIDIKLHSIEQNSNKYLIKETV